MNAPLVTFGGAGGFFSTGLFVDFTNRDVVHDDLAQLVADISLVHLESLGLYYNQFLSNALESMGVCGPEQGAFTGFLTGEPTTGFGFHHVDASRAADYAAAKAVMGDHMPVLTS
ncbi:MAG: hypothetical protein GY822_05980 [Deltaproteobacteria bacterium]|nr:hypothetical protein [Deltaproteobacteria bacterium]